MSAPSIKPPPSNPPTVKPSWLSRIKAVCRIENSWQIRNIDIHSMAFPVRLALWCGVLVVAYSVISEQPLLALAGTALVVLGAGLWLYYADTPFARWYHRRRVNAGIEKARQLPPKKKN